MGIDRVGLQQLQMHRDNLRLDQPGGSQKEAVKQFEGYFVQMMIREMRKTVPKGIFDSPNMSMFIDLLDQ